MGQFTRTIKDWKDDVQGVWGRLKTFHRIALGIMLGMLMVYAARGKVLDPLQAELTKKREALDKKGVPIVVPSVEEGDSDIQETRIRLENLRETGAKWQQRMEQALRQRPQIDRANRSDVLSEFERLIVNSGMVLQNRSPYPADAAQPEQQNPNREADAGNRGYPLSTWAHQYELAGTFESVCKCLASLGKFPYPAHICRIEVQLVENATNAATTRGGEPLILLRFLLELYYHDK
jgi:hypothetical protein